MSLCLGETKITPCIHSALLQDKNVTITENGIQSVIADNQYNGLGEVIINTNVIGDLMERDVNFYDYDGTLVNSYWKENFLTLTEMPENPSHNGLIAQGWNWTLSDAKDFVTEYGMLDIGQIYTTASGLSEFDIELTSITGLVVTLNMDGTKNWGDGTIDTDTTHTYTNYGRYTITCDGTIITSSANVTLFGVEKPGGSSATNICKWLLAARLTNISSIPDYSFAQCPQLMNITFSNDLIKMQYFIFAFSYLKFIVFPSTLTQTNSYIFNSVRALNKFVLGKNTALGSFGTSAIVQAKRIIFPNTGYISDNGSGCPNVQEFIPGLQSSVSFYYNPFGQNNYLKRIIFRSTNTGISGTFGSRKKNLILDFTRSVQVVTLSSSTALQNNNDCIIIVPDNLYNDWIVATNWDAYATNIIKESDYNA